MFEDDIHIKIGKHIRKLRQSRNWNQEELSYQSQISSSHLGHIERGEQNPTLETLSKISKGLQIEMADLFDFDDVLPVQSSIRLSSYQSHFDSLPEDKQKCIIKVLNCLMDLADPEE